MGIPMHLWTEANIRKIGSCLGIVTSVHYRKDDVSRVEVCVTTESTNPNLMNMGKIVVFDDAKTYYVYVRDVHILKPSKDEGMNISLSLGETQQQENQENDATGIVQNDRMTNEEDIQPLKDCNSDTLENQEGDCDDTVAKELETENGITNTMILNYESQQPTCNRVLEVAGIKENDVELT